MKLNTKNIQKSYNNKVYNLQVKKLNIRRVFDQKYKSKV